MPHDDILRRQRGSARMLRRNQTDTERKLWHILRAHRFENVGFRRQVPIGPYIADFVAHRMRLIIEVDGGQHATEAGAARDRRRDDWLVGRGYTVLRFPDNDVMGNMDGVAETIAKALPKSVGTA